MARRNRAAGQANVTTLQVVTEEPAGSYNRYLHDTRRNALRLTEVATREGSRPFERGAMLNTAGADGAPVQVLNLVSIPTFPGCLVEARLLGIASSTDEPAVAITAAAADQRWDGVRDIGELDTSLREELEAEITGFSGWMPATETRHLIRMATERFWVEKARAESAARHGAAWKITGPAPGAAERGEAEPHSWAEHLIPSLPARFQRYVEQMLLPEERILFFAERPEFAPSGRITFFRSQKLRHGLFIITDRQVMIMLDSLPPDSTMVDWGYLAKATAVERITSAWVERRDSTAEVTLSACALGGEERFTLAFPGGQEEALGDAVDLLRGFVEPGEAAPARAYVDDPGLPEPELPFGELAARYPYLLDVTGGEPVLAAAASRGPEGRGLGPAVAVTAAEVRVFTGSSSTRRPVEVRRIPIVEVSSVELLQSLIRSRFDIFVPGDEEVDRVTMRYDYPDSPAFLRAFIAIRHLMGRPLAAPVR